MEAFFKLLATFFDALIYIVMGFFGLFFLIFILAMIFGKRIIKKWEYEANFYNDNNREIGEFDIEMKKYSEEEDFSLDAKFVLKHKELTKGSVVQVFLENVLVMEGTVENEGRVYLKNEHLKSEIENPEAGQICRVTFNTIELSEPLIID